MGREFTRQELYDLVWCKPLRTLAKTLHISDVRLAKICRRANIPLPGLGYWAKRAYGKASPNRRCLLAVWAKTIRSLSVAIVRRTPVCQTKKSSAYRFRHRLISQKALTTSPPAPAG